MSLAHTYKSILDTVSFYENLLGRVSDDRFSTTPPDGGWSYAEVFAHIFNSNSTCIMVIDKCIQDQGIETDKSAPIGVKLVFFFGRLPPGKYKMPERLKSQVSKINKSEAQDLIRKFKDDLSQITPRVASANPKMKLKHPRLGMLNASQWYKFIDIHTRHHRKQLERIDLSLN